MQGRRIRAMGWLAVGSLCLAGAVGCQSTGTPGATPTDSEWREGPTGEAPSARQGEGSGPSGSAHGLKQVYFELDRSKLDSEARDVLSRNARRIQENPDWGTVVVEGHCDERGSEEYNLGLGARRAESVSRYLQDLGVDADRLRTVSFGEDRPAVEGHSESAWRYNRRSELQVRPRQASN